MASQLHPGLGIAFGIELHHLQPVRGDVGQKRDVVSFGHVMVHMDKMLVFHVFDEKLVSGIDFFGLQSRKRNAAAVDCRVAEGMDDVAANMADIEFATHHISGCISVGYGRI